MITLPTRSVVAAGLIEGLFNTMAEFEADGFENFACAWEKYDWLRGQRVTVDLLDDHVSGVCQGIDVDGALILQTPTGRRQVTSGTVRFSGLVGHPGTTQ
jgi:BirA family biotin operon repressor/biotin-[acetyl-CoA-carboxylase] ligase